MKMFEASIGTIIMRFYLMMAVVIVSLFAGLTWAAMLALPIFLSAMLGVSFKQNKKKNSQDIINSRQMTSSHAQQAA